MGFFERNLGALGETLDDGLDRARDQTRELCDREGWSDRTERVREHAREKRELAQRAATGLWRDLGEDRQRTLLAALATAGVIAAALVGRSLLIDQPEGPTRAEMELIDRARRQSDTGAPWTATTEPVNATPWGGP